MRGALARERRLLARDRQSRDPTAVRRRGMEREAAPAAADLQHVVGLVELELRAEALEFRALRFGQRDLGRGENRARVRHRLVEHQLEELVAEVVVVGDVAARAEQSIASVRTRAQLEQPADARVTAGGRVRVAQQELEEADEIVRVPLLGGVRLAEPELAAGREPAEERTIVNGEPHRRARAEAADVAVGQLDLEQSAFEPRQRSLEHRNEIRSRSRPRARGAARRGRSAVLMLGPIPRRGRTAACGGTARA